MLVRVTMDIEVPGIEGWSDDEVNQLIFDTVTNYMSCQHQMDAIKWLAQTKGKPISSHEHRIFKYHETWAKILQDAQVRTIRY